MKKKTRLQKSTAILEDSNFTKWCYVNVNNEFTYKNQLYIIDENVDEYKVFNKAGTTDDFTNEAYMEEILVVTDKENNLRFYNQNYDEVDGKLVRVEKR